MPQSTVPAAATGLPASTEAHGRIPAGGHATIIPADRREFLRQLAAASVLTIPVAAAAFVHGDPDAELARLGAEFERHYAEYVALAGEMIRIGDRFEEEAERQGIDPRHRRDDYPKWVRLRHDVGYEAAITSSNAKAEIIDEIAKRIRAIPAAGIAGMAVKAAVLHFDCLTAVDHVGYWNDESYDPDDWGIEQVHNFVAEIRAIAGGSHV
ncbi:MAG: hypothetical protein WBL57_06090 [Methylovirgula sp.]